MSSKVYDVIVVGAGVEGSATAYSLAKQGKKTLLLEKFPLPHSRGSSHGHSRITRKAYGSDDHYTRMMVEAYRLWDDVERDSGTDIFKQCGCLAVGPEGDEFVTETIKSMDRYGMPYTPLSGKELKEKYPMLTYPSSYQAVLDHSGGVLRSDVALTALQTLFKENGGELHDGEEMTSLFPGSTITITTNKGQYKSRSVVLTVGPWATKVLPQYGIHLPLQSLKIMVLYWPEIRRGAHSIDTFPCIIERKVFDGKYGIYSLPSEEYPGLVKVCLHFGPDIDPDRRDDVDTTWVLDKMKGYISKHFNGLEPRPSLVETCIYTNTPDHDFVLDTHPVWKNIVVGAGFSGHGFKLAPVVGKVLAELATGQTPSYDMTPFRMSRFNPEKAKL